MLPAANCLQMTASSNILYKMANLLNPLKQRRSVRRFQNRLVPEHLIIQMIEMGQRAPTASELYSVILVRDPDKRRQLPYKRENAEILVICVDFHRLRYLLKSQGEDIIEMDSWLFIWGLIDASLFLQNIITAAEIFGLGSVILGGIALEMRKVCQVLEIPKYVIPIAGLAVGYADEDPPLRPRLDINNVLHLDRYQLPDIKKLMTDIKRIEADRADEKYYVKYCKRCDDNEYDYLKHTILKFSNRNIKMEQIAAYKKILNEQLNINLIESSR